MCHCTSEIWTFKTKNTHENGNGIYKLPMKMMTLSSIYGNTGHVTSFSNNINDKDFHIHDSLVIIYIVQDKCKYFNCSQHKEDTYCLW